MSQVEKANRFCELHRAPGAFVIANAWDGGSARILESVGFPALATSSGATAEPRASNPWLTPGLS
jgi:2-methylisocitrate lyase-like PEP mutase family enzyme